MLEISYQLMLESLGQAILKSEISDTANTPVLSPNVQKMIEIQDERLQKYPCGEYYQQRLATSMEKAQTYRLANRRDLAIEIFDDILSWVAVVDQPYVQRWRCITDAEQLLKQSIIHPEDFEKILSKCGTYAKKHSEKIANENINQAPVKKETLEVIPNPASNKATFIYSLPEKTSSAEIRITNLLGKLIEKYQVVPGSTSIEVDCTELKSGIYFYSLITDNNLVNTKKMIITK